jgi:hypothetical protein
MQYDSNHRIRIEETDADWYLMILLRISQNNSS